MNRTIMFLLLSNMCWAEELQLKILPRRSLKTFDASINKHKATSKVNRNSKIDSALARLEEQNRQINQGLGLLQQKPGIWDFTNQYDLRTGTVLRGILLNSIVSTNLESPLLVEVKAGQGLPPKAKFSCIGVTKYKRVVAACNRLIMPDQDREFEVQVSLLNPDGSSGLKADYYYTGQEEFVAASVATSFARGMIEVQTQRLATPLGEITANTSKNRILNGALSATDDINSLMKNEMQNKETKVYVESGKEVLVYFHERFKL
ncbi:MAG TPA: TrbI/VirB10 family protein [Bacteriovoracaceae bacterium]|nr:TrbI/VirB10 family protein [Bacteriovoracaceae bacterium]